MTIINLIILLNWDVDYIIMNLESKLEGIVILKISANVVEFISTANHVGGQIHVF